MFMNHYLKITFKNIEIASFPLKNESYREIPIFNQTAILQYVFELLMLIKYQFIFIEDEKDTVIKRIFDFVEAYIVNIDCQKEINKPLSYVFPKIYGNK